MNCYIFAMKDHGRYVTWLKHKQIIILARLLNYYYYNRRKIK